MRLPRDGTPATAGQAVVLSGEGSGAALGSRLLRAGHKARDFELLGFEFRDLFRHVVQVSFCLRVVGMGVDKPRENRAGALQCGARFRKGSLTLVGCCNF